jgi:hypothetical protein
MTLKVGVLWFFPLYREEDISVAIKTLNPTDGIIEYTQTPFEVILTTFDVKIQYGFKWGYDNSISSYSTNLWLFHTVFTTPLIIMTDLNPNNSQIYLK